MTNKNQQEVFFRGDRIDLENNPTLNDLKEWENYEGDLEDCLHVYFSEEFKKRDWLDIHEEGSRLYSIMFDTDVEENSPIDYLFEAVAAAAATGAFIAISKAIGIENNHHLQIAVEDYYCNNSDAAPIGYDGLKEAVERVKKELKKTDEQ